jgi:cytochrome c biogenesis protein CcmG/thiol:disulfide interchange protein DsbE
VKKLIFLVPVVVFLGITAFFYAGLRNGPPTILPSPLVGKPAPNVEMEALAPQYTTYKPEDLKSGKPVLINFWASWCAPCRLEAPLLEDLAEREGLTLYGIAYKDDPVLAQRFLDEFGNPFVHIAADLDGRGAIEWGVTGFPETFVVDGDGIIRAHYAGPLTEAVVEDIILPAAGR